MSLFARIKEGLHKTGIKDGLSKTRRSFTGRLNALLSIGKVDDTLLDELESLLITSDFGLETTERLIDEAQKRSKRENQDGAAFFKATLKEIIWERLSPADRLPFQLSEAPPHVILVVGVNGVGKTTTIGKLASHLQAADKKVMLAAGDTFRAAAVAQLETWGKRVGCPVIAQGQHADSAAVIHDAYSAAVARHMDLLIADTAGRLHTKTNLMEELKKVKRVLQRKNPQAPHDVWLVLDATTGQNAIQQVRHFHDSMGLTGLVITKLDGTAKGGVVVAISEQFGLPIHFVGVGEGVDDLRPFDPDAFVDALFTP